MRATILGPALCLAVAGGVAVLAGSCASRPTSEPAATPRAAAVGMGADGGYPIPQSTAKGVILPGDPASGTGSIGGGVAPTSTGTAGSRINPGSTSGDNK
jgi:hypothetical protein